MYAIALLLIFASLVYKHARHSEHDLVIVPRRIGDRMSKLWEIAYHGMRENRFLRAEKALLTILKIDERNAAAYNRLGPETFSLLAKAYESRGMHDDAAKINKKLQKLIMPAGRPKRILRPKRVVI
jgi:hypothetical protein